MRLICPSCGAMHSAEAWVNDGEARQCLLLVAELPAEVGRRALPYLGLFRPSGSGRGLTWGKALRLLAEIKQMVGESHIQWDRSPARPNSPAAWAEALEVMVQRPPKQLPLTSHGYLRKVAYDVADRRDKSIEIKRNRDERTGNGRRSEDRPALHNGSAADDGWRPGPEEFARIKQAVKGIGG